MQKLFVLVVALACVAGCVGSKTECVPAGTTFAVARTNGTGDCPADVTAGINTLNGTETFPIAKAASCGVVNYKITSNFIQQSGSGQTCHGADAMSFPDFMMDGGAGTDVMTVTCDSGVTCTETYDVTLTPQ